MRISRFGSSAILTVTASVLAFGLLLQLPAASAGDPLWEKAVSLAQQMESDGVVFGAMEMHSLVKKKDGSVETDLRMTYRTVVKGDEIDAEVVSATENGKDITAKIREEEKKDNKDDEEEMELSITPGEHPFDPEIQENITYQRVGPADLEGRKTVLFRFTHKLNKKEGVTGRAWLDPITGAPIVVETKPDPLPKMMDEMTSRTMFKVTKEGYWVPEAGVMNGSGGFLWIKRWMVMKITFSDYRLKETLNPSAEPKT